MIERLGRLFRRPRSGAPGEFQTFLDRQAAFVAQKTVLDYCRVKAGLRERQMFANPEFQAALVHCRWQTFAGAVQDVTALAEAWLRPHAAGREAQLAAALAAVGARILADAPVPPEEADSLTGAAAALERHLSDLQDAPPRSADRLPLLAEAPLLATLPIHPDQRIGETPAIRGALRFHIVTTQQEMERAFDAPALAANLVSA
ncbi:MAG: hypothetical protein RLZZ187_23 [Pseudomonadota bacterium]|jgi:hypothetical protein